MSAVRRLLPFLNWFPLQPATLKADLIAGFTVALLAIPQSLACALLAGVPVHFGLYGALLPTIIGAMFGSSHMLSTGPVQITALLTAASVVQLAPRGGADYYSYVVLLALMSGALQVAFGTMRMGVLFNFVSFPVLMGFINAAAIVIALSQLPAILGAPAVSTSNFLLDIWQVLGDFHAMHATSIVFCVAAMVLLAGFRKLAPRLPDMLLTVALLTAISYYTGYEHLGGSVVGAVPVGLPQFSVPSLDWNSTTALLPAAFVIALISFMEAASSCKVISIKTRAPWDENQELIGQGLAKIAAAFSQAMPVSGSFSRSALNLAAGARTGMASVVAALCVLLTLIFFTPLLHHLPLSVLAAIIITALFNLVDYKSIVQAWRASPDDGVAATVTFVVTLAFAPNIQVGVVTGIMLSLVLLLYRLMRPRVALLGLHADGTLRDAKRLNLPELHAELGAMRFDGSLIFVNVSYFENAVLQLEQEHARLKYILVAAGGINTIDASGIEVLARLAARMRENGLTLTLSGVKQQVLVVMERSGLTQTLGVENIFPTDIIGLNTLLQRLEHDSPAQDGAPSR